MKSVKAHKQETVDDSDCGIAMNIPMHPSHGTLKIKVKDDQKQAFYEERSMKLNNCAIQYLVDRHTRPFLENEVQEAGKVYKVHLTYYSEIKTPTGIFCAHRNYQQQYQ